MIVYVITIWFKMFCNPYLIPLTVKDFMQDKTGEMGPKDDLLLQISVYHYNYIYTLEDTCRFNWLWIMNEIALLVL